MYCVCVCKLFFNHYLIIIWSRLNMEYMLLRKKQITSWISENSDADSTQNQFVSSVLIRNQFLAHACCRLRIFNDANLVAQHGIPTRERERQKEREAYRHIRTFARTCTRDILAWFFFFANLYGQNLVYRSVKLKEK